MEITFEEKVWRIPSSGALHDFIKKDPQHLHKLYGMLQKDHAELFGSPINISRSSFVVEIWAHLFVEKFIGLGKHLTWLALIERLYDQVTKHTSVIDCGEAPDDSNRKIWDQLARIFDPVSDRISTE